MITGGSMRVMRFLLLSGLFFMSFNTSAEIPQAAKKILFVDSYHEGYAWSDGIVEGVRSVLLSRVIAHTPKNPDKNPAGIELKILRMDTKRNGSEEFKQLAGLRAKSEIQAFQPDVVIACDDNAARYLIEPFYKDADLPFVFCGVNWDASIYGFPYKNITGMIEIDLVDEILAHLKTYAKGERIGVIGAENESNHKSVESYRKHFGIEPVQTYFPADFAAWKQDFSHAQEAVDMLIVLNHVGINDWNEAEAKAFVGTHSKIPSGTPFSWEMPYVLLGLTNVAQEQGIWTAQTALKILNGARPAEIPIVFNEQSHLILNLRLAEKLDITFDPALLKLAEIIR